MLLILMAGGSILELGELYPTSHERQAVDGRCGVDWCSETRLVRNVRKDQMACFTPNWDNILHFSSLAHTRASLCGPHGPNITYST